MPIAGVVEDFKTNSMRDVVKPIAIYPVKIYESEIALKIQADQILPEVGVSQILSYNLGESELSVDAQIELDIREAPLRELLLNIPKGSLGPRGIA